MTTEINLLYPLLFTAASLTLACFCAAHVVLYKRDVRAAIGWVGVIWLTPFIGSLLYIMFGVNRLERKARKILGSKASHSHVPEEFVAAAHDPDHTTALADLDRFVANVTRHPLLSGNRIDMFDEGDSAYGAMFEAIEKAERSIGLMSYIFDNDRAGRMFAERLAAAHRRGVAVRVLIDDVGARYTWPSIRGTLRASGVPVHSFLPTLIPWKLNYSNLRNHRKILTVDGKIGFTGGMNIREGHMPSMNAKHAIDDMHFRFAGPVVEQLQETFTSDWEFVAGETLDGEAWFPPQTKAGEILARGLPDGPDFNADQIRLAMMGALACARRSVLIQTPYFLPDAALISALNTADLRGVDVKVILPEKCNLKLVQWAATAQLWQVLKRGVQVWYAPPPFDHSKLMTIDDSWALVGSANWDPRSLRLNFEFNVECYDREFASRLADRLREKISRSRPVTLAEVDARSLPIRLRDGVARLFSPYL